MHDGEGVVNAQRAWEEQGVSSLARNSHGMGGACCQRGGDAVKGGQGRAGSGSGAAWDAGSSGKEGLDGISVWRRRSQLHGDGAMSSCRGRDGEVRQRKRQGTREEGRGRSGAGKRSEWRDAPVTMICRRSGLVGNSDEVVAGPVPRSCAGTSCRGPLPLGVERGGGLRSLGSCCAAGLR